MIASDWIDFHLLGKKWGGVFFWGGGGGACSQTPPHPPPHFSKIFMQNNSMPGLDRTISVVSSSVWSSNFYHMLPLPPPPPPPPFLSFQWWKPQWPHLLCAHLSVCIVPSRLRTRLAQRRRRPRPPRSECGTQDLRGINPSVGGSWHQTARRKTRVGTLPQFVSANSKSTHKGVN